MINNSLSTETMNSYYGHKINNGSTNLDVDMQQCCLAIMLPSVSAINAC